MGVNISEMLGGAELLETSSISMEESLRYSIDIGMILVACVAGGILSRVRGQREAMAAEPPILAAKPREASGDFTACVAGGILSRVRGQREAMVAEPPILAAKPREASGEAAR